MKILHTADWHVGQGIRGRSRTAEHSAVLEEIVRVAEEEAVDLVLVTGDQFHTGAPSPEAESIVYQALMQLTNVGAHVHVLTGNHDNPNRLRAVTPFLELTNVTVCTHPVPADEGGLIEVTTQAGETCLIASIPFLSKRTIVRADDIMSLDASQHEGKYRERYRAIVEALTGRFGPDTVNIVAAHVTVQGGTLAGGERESQSIFDYVVPSSVFPVSAHYVALGHLHATQKIEGGVPIWYPGSPLQMDFGDKARKKTVLIVDAKPGTPAKVSRIELASGRRLRTWRGSLEQLTAKVDSFGDDYLRIQLDEARRTGLADEVREIAPNVVEVTLVQQDDLSKEEKPGEIQDLRGSPIALFGQFLAEQNIDDREVTALFEQLLEETLAADTP